MTSKFRESISFAPMNFIRSIWHLILKEIILEFRLSYAISGILLYVLSTVFIIYIAFKKVDPEVWNALFWIVMLFASVNAIGKSFVQENSNRQLYYYSLIDPLAIILAKIIYNVVLLALLGFIIWVAFSFIGGNPVEKSGQFALAVFLGASGLSITFTFISAISAKADNSATLMAILSFPLVIPILLTLVEFSGGAIGLFSNESFNHSISTLAGIDLLLVGGAIILFPFLWRD